MTNHHTLEQVPGDFITTLEAPKAHHSNKSGGPGHGCSLSGQHPDNNQLIASNCQYRDEIANEARVKGISPQQTSELSSHEITETLNVLVDDGLSMGSQSYT